MRVLLYGMQSSGASLVTYFLGQAPRTVAVVDLWNSILMPPLEMVDADSVVAKAVVAMNYDFEEHVRSFRPDRRILLLRHPAQNYVSLSRKSYANENGSVDEKFEKLEAVFRRPELFDLTLLYEDFVQRPEYTVRALQNLGIRTEGAFYGFPRDPEEMKRFNCEQSEWCREHFENGWRFGNIRGTDLRPELLFKHAPRSIDEHVRRLCPTLCAYFDERSASRMSSLRQYNAAMWNDIVIRRWKLARQRVGGAIRARLTKSQQAPARAGQ